MMKKFLFLMTMMASTLAVRAAGVEPYAGSRIFWDTATRTTIFNGGGYARLIELQDGRLMAVCESGGIKVAFSTNKGTNWGAATLIAPNPAGVAEAVPDLIQLTDGTIIVAYNPRPSAPYSEDRKFGIRCRRSTDNGRTWSDEIFVNDAHHTFSDGCWEPSMVELPSGEVQLYFADEGPYTMNGDQQISMCRSEDGGLTWTAPQKICYRQGFRDGMPVPVLLRDQSEIVVIIEDNGWGYGDFFPTTVRTTLANNWHDGYWVDAADRNRAKTLNLSYCPTATGGAPYLRVLPWGETVMSYQSSYDNNGKLQMRVAVGNSEARDFKAMSVPFSIGANEEGLWNSLAVIDTGVVVAVSGIAGNIEMIKGYPVRQLTAPYGQPAVDGRVTANEGYKTRTATQILLGSQTGTRVAADLAYDRDSLYVVARVSDRTLVPNGANADALTLLLDVSGEVNDKPATDCYELMIRPDGTLYRLLRGNGSSWRNADKTVVAARIATKQASTNYVVEVAIPWSGLQLAAPPVDRRLAFALECTDNRQGTAFTETIPDARASRPFTWMELRLGTMPEDAAVGVLRRPAVIDERCYDLLGRRIGHRDYSNHQLITIRNGRKYLTK